MDKQKPDELYLMTIIQHIESKTADWDMDDVLAQSGDVILENTVLQEIKVSFVIPNGVRDMNGFFISAAQTIVRTIQENGFNVCRPIGIVDPNMLARDGTIQLCKRGQKISMYMSHRYDGDTTVTLKMLVGVK